jgi:hypothetical protein
MTSISSSTSSAVTSQAALLQAEAKLAVDQAATAADVVIKADRGAVDKAAAASGQTTAMSASSDLVDVTV